MNDTREPESYSGYLETEPRRERATSAPADTAPASAAVPAAKAVAEFDGDRLAFEFEISRCIRYHAKRTAFFDGLNRLTRAASTIFAAAAIVALVGDKGFLTELIAAILAVALSADLVVDYSRQARLYDDLRRRFAALLGEFEAYPPTIPAELAQFKGKRRLIELDEPPPLGALNVICANEELEARGYPYRHRVTRLQRLLRHFISWRDTEFPFVPAPGVGR